MQEARVRDQLEGAYEQLKSIRKVVKTNRPRPKATPKDVIHRRAVHGVVCENGDDDVIMTVEDEQAPETIYTPLNEVSTPTEEEIEVLVASPWYQTRDLNSALIEPENEI